MFWRGCGSIALALVFLAGCASGPGFTKREPQGWTVPLANLGIDGSLEMIAYPHPWDVKEISSYDRTGGNNDDHYGHETFDGGIVLADLKGPGCLMRIWTRNPWGTLHIYVDDMNHPIMTLPFQDLFSGELELYSPGFNLFAPPFVGTGSGGYFCYVPIPYSERCKLVVTGENNVLSYQVNYAEFPVATPIESFALPLSGDDRSFFRAWKKSWEDTNLRYHDRKTEQLHISTTNIYPNSNVLVLPIKGPGVLTEIEMEFESADPEINDNLWIDIYFDGQDQPGVLAPLADFLGHPVSGANDTVSVALGNQGGRMWCRYPMPFKSYAEIRLINLSDQIADVKYSITWKPGEVEDQYYFFARYNAASTVRGKPYPVADIEGRGHFVGASVAVEGASSLSILEGDAIYYVDDKGAGNFHGTGTDDYFNAGWHFSTGPFSAATHATSYKASGRQSGFAAYRSHIIESVPFDDSFRFDLEHGPQNDSSGARYASVAYWYQQEREPLLWHIPELEGVILKP